MSAVRQLKARPGKGLQRRTVVIALSGDFEGWEALAYADFKVKHVADLVSGDIDRVLGALDRIIISHNFPDADDETVIAKTFGDIDSAGLTAFVDGLFEEIGKLPKR